MTAKFLRVLIFLTLITFILGLFGKFNWVLDVFSHFRVYYCIAFLVFGIVGLVFRQWKEGGISLVLSLILFLTFADLFITKEKDAVTSSIKIVSINLLSSNNNFKEVIDFIQTNDFEIVFFQELNSKWEKELEILEEEFTLNEMYPREDNFGIGVFSKIERAYVQETDFSTVNIPSLILTVQYEGEELKIINTHPLPPVGSDYFKARNTQFEIIDRVISKMDHEIVLIGDLNSSRFSPNFKRLLKNGKLRDSRKGFGLLPTWHAQFPFISVTLDHVLVTDRIEVLDRNVGPDIGSDHLPIIIEIGIK